MDTPGEAAPGDEGAPGDEAAQAGVGPEGEGSPEGEKARGPLGMPAHGTKKIKVGLVVPEDFQLPAGYVRHYQTTDKGEMLSAILMFDPDHPPLDAQGRPVAVPADRVVPPELAPSGMPQAWLDVPDSAYSNPDEHDAPTDAERAAAEAAAAEEGEGSPD